MKRLLTIFLALFATVTFGQNAVRTITVPSFNTLFGQTLANKTMIICTDSSKIYQLTQSASATMSLATTTYVSLSGGGGGASTDSLFWSRSATSNTIFNKTASGLWINGTTGSTPTSGAGTRLMWIPSKAAFRAGVVAGNYWDAENIGTNSFAVGLDNLVSGHTGAAFGYGNTVSGATGNSANFAVGYGNVASGVYGAITIGQSNTASGYNACIAIGYSTTSTGDYGSLSINSGTRASGNSALSAGIGTTAQAQASAVFGRYNVISGTTNSWVSTDPLFVIGNGTGTGANSNNAFTIFKNGSGKFDVLASVPSGAVEGQFYYDGTTHKLYVYDGTSWQSCW